MNHILSLFVLVVGTSFFAGCDKLLIPSAIGPTEGSEAAARQHVDREFMEWIGGERSEVSTIKSSGKRSPVNYEVLSVTAHKGDFMAIKNPQDLPPGWQEWPAFRFNTSIEFVSEAGTPLKQIATYSVGWDPRNGEWFANERP